MIAALFVVCALLPVIIVAHHPRTVHNPRFDEAFHVALIAVAVAIQCGLILYVLRCVADNSLSVVVIVLSSLGTVGIVLAGSTDGFFVPWFQSYVSSGQVDARSAHAIFRSAWISIEILSKLSFVAMGCVGVMLSMEMLRDRRFAVAGTIGTVAALFLVAFAAIGGPLGPHNLFVAAAGLAGWCCALAYRLATQ